MCLTKPIIADNTFCGSWVIDQFFHPNMHLLDLRMQLVRQSLGYLDGSTAEQAQHFCRHCCYQLFRWAVI